MGARRPSDLSPEGLFELVSDLGRMSTAAMVGFRVDPGVVRRLQLLGVGLPEILDFPALAYRMGAIRGELSRKRISWNRVIDAARSRPLSVPERYMVQHLRRRAGIHLRPIFDATGHVWTAHRELVPLRRVLESAVVEKRSVNEAIRELGALQRSQGIVRDAERVVRTEIADSRSRGAWDAESGSWPSDARLFRQTSVNACRWCIRVYREPDGSPRLYTREEFERGDSEPLDRRDVPRIGPNHPNCACGPVEIYHDAMRHIFAVRAPQFAKVYEKYWGDES